MEQLIELSRRLVTSIIRGAFTYLVILFIENAQTISRAEIVFVVIWSMAVGLVAYVFNIPWLSMFDKWLLHIMGIFLIAWLLGVVLLKDPWPMVVLVTALMYFMNVILNWWLDYHVAHGMNTQIQKLHQRVK